MAAAAKQRRRARRDIGTGVRADDNIAATLTILAVIARIVANPISNLFQKQLAQRSAEPLTVIVVTHGLGSVLALPFLARLPLAALGVDFWANIVTAVVLAVIGYVFLWYALRSSDLSVLGPINAYKAVIGLLLAVVLIGEVPTVAGLAGVALIVAGSYFVVDRVPGQARRNAFRQFIREPGVRLRFAALTCSATESIFLKRALLLSSPIAAFLVWTVLCFAIAGIGALLLRQGVTKTVTRLGGEWRTLLALAATTSLMQFTTLVTFQTLQVGYSLALFQLSALVTVYLGHRYFQERNIKRRLVGSVIMVMGAILIVALGRRP
jgi:drug/metabolite transporter (DMT)-like permease